MRTLLILVVGFLLALSVGLGSTWYMIARGSPLTTGQFGPWSVWFEAGNPEADPYTKAYLARSGRLPITSTNALYYFARTDDSGQPLRASCDYVIDGKPINAAWWSLAVYDTAGRLIPNKAGRHSFSRTDIVRQADGSFRIVLSSAARPGNWLPTGDSETVQLVLRVYGPRDFNATVGGDPVERHLPEIQMVGCK